MNLDELRAVKRKERQKDSLQHLRDTFYADVADYIQNLKAERREAAEKADDPFSSPEVSRLTDEIETAEEEVEAVYERRVGKVVKLSSFAAADMNADEEGLTAEERELFEDLVGRIKDNRSTVLDILAGEASPASDGDGDGAAGPDDPTPDTGTGPGVDADVNPGAPDGAPSAAPPETPETSETPEARSEGDADRDAESDAPDGGVLSDAMGAGTDRSESAGTEAGAGGDPASEAGTETGTETPDATAPTGDAGSTSDAAGPASGGAGPSGPAEGSAPKSESESASDAADDRITVRLTRDVGRILGVDEREYELASEDVVTLPTPNAEPLIERDAAERIE